MNKLLFISISLFLSFFSFGKDYIKKEGVPTEIINQMIVVEVDFKNYLGKNTKGFLVVNKKIAKEVQDIFVEIQNSGFQIEKIIPISEYDWNDDESMKDNNTSAYNYRFVANTTKLSNHSYGMAIDINPRYNPMIVKDNISPTNGEYSEKNLGTITSQSEIVKIFKRKGWKWGGDYKSLKDYQHFEKIYKK